MVPGRKHSIFGYSTMTLENSKSTSRSSARLVKPTSNPIHGFLVVYEDGSQVSEKNNFWSETLQRVSATNWHEVDQNRISRISLYWKGSLVISLDKKEVRPETWFFSHTGALQVSGGSKVTIVSRNIGFVREGRKYLYKVVEDTGALLFDEQEAR